MRLVSPSTPCSPLICRALSRRYRDFYRSLLEDVNFCEIAFGEPPLCVVIAVLESGTWGLEVGLRSRWAARLLTRA